MRFGWAPLIVGMVAGSLAAADSIPTTSDAAAPPARLASAYQSYRLGLTTLVTPSTNVMGLILKARVDGGPALRLLLDSGAQYLVLERKAARKSGHASPGSDLDLVGAGASPRAAKRSVASLVQVGEVEFRDCPMVIVDGKVLDGIDGVIPLSLFAEFLVRLDIPRKCLELEPYPKELPLDNLSFVGVRAENKLLFLQTRLGEVHEGYLLLDTGSSYNVISNTAAVGLRQSRALAQALPITTGAGQVDGRMLNCRVSFKLGSRQFSLDPVVAVDLSELSQRHRIEIAGVIGYPALAGSVLTVNYRDSLVRIQAK